MAVEEGSRGSLEEMVRQYTSWPSDLVEAYRAASGLVGEPPFGRGLIVGCGMGGSGFSLDAGKHALEEAGYRVVVVKSHTPPPYVGPDVPVVAVSYSGSTVETLECARRALERGAPACGVAGEGSPLYRLLSSRGYPVAPVKRRGLPRTSLGTLVGSILGLLLPGEAEGLVERVSQALDPEWALSEARRVARALEGGRLPVIVACGAYESLAVRWRTELAENTEIPALVEAYPEAGHNAVNVWTHRPSGPGYVFIVLKANVDDKLCSYIEDWAVDEYSRVGEVVPVDLRQFAELHPLAAILEGSMVAGIASSMAAASMGRDPAATPGIRRYRSALESLKARGRWGEGFHA